MINLVPHGLQNYITYNNKIFGEDIVDCILAKGVCLKVYSHIAFKSSGIIRKNNLPNHTLAV